MLCAFARGSALLWFIGPLKKSCHLALPRPFLKIWPCTKPCQLALPRPFVKTKCAKAKCCVFFACFAVLTEAAVAHRHLQSRVKLQFRARLRQRNVVHVRAWLRCADRGCCGSHVPYKPMPIGPCEDKILCIFTRGSQPLRGGSAQSLSCPRNDVAVRSSAPFRENKMLCMFPRALLCPCQLASLCPLAKAKHCADKAVPIGTSAPVCQGEMLCIFARGSHPLGGGSPSSVKTRPSGFPAPREDVMVGNSVPFRENTMLCIFLHALLCWSMLLWIIHR